MVSWELEKTRGILTTCDWPRDKDRAILGPKGAITNLILIYDTIKGEGDTLLKSVSGSTVIL